MKLSKKTAKGFTLVEILIGVSILAMLASGMWVAVASYQNKKLKEELKTLKQNQKNKERSTGSKKSAGKKTVDKWFEGWPDD